MDEKLDKIIGPQGGGPGFNADDFDIGHCEIFEVMGSLGQGEETYEVVEKDGEHFWKYHSYTKTGDNR